MSSFVPRSLFSDLPRCKQITLQATTSMHGAVLACFPPAVVNRFFESICQRKAFLTQDSLVRCYISFLSTAVTEVHDHGNKAFNWASGPKGLES